MDKNKKHIQKCLECGIGFICHKTNKLYCSKQCHSIHVKAYLKDYSPKYWAQYVKRPGVRESLRENSRNYAKTERCKQKAKLRRKTKNYKEYRRKYESQPHMREKKRIYDRMRLARLRKTKKYQTKKNAWQRKQVVLGTQSAIAHRLRSRFRGVISRYIKIGKISYSKCYGIDYKKIINHLKPFPEDPSKYHIDHIRPLCSFDLTDPNQVRQAFSPQNHQWLMVKENLKKGAKYSHSDPSEPVYGFDEQDNLVEAESLSESPPRAKKGKSKEGSK